MNHSSSPTRTNFHESGAPGRAYLHVTVTVLPHIALTSKGLGKLLKGLDGAQVEDLGAIFTEMDEDKAEAVAQNLSGLKELRRLNFSASMQVSDKAWEGIMMRLQHSHIEEINFRRCRLNDAKVRAIAGCLSKLKSIRRLDLSWNREVSAAGWKVLLEALRDSQISSLNFDYCLLTVAKANAIASVLPELPDTLNRSGLSLAGNYQLTEECINMLMDKLPNRGGPHSLSPQTPGDVGINRLQSVMTTRSRNASLASPDMQLDALPIDLTGGNASFSPRSGNASGSEVPLTPVRSTRSL